MSSFSVLTLAPAQFESEPIGNVVRGSISYYLDFEVDGRSLVALVRASGNLITELNKASLPVGVEDTIEVLLGERLVRGLPPGRVPLLVCPFDGDVSCGAVTAALTRTVDAVTWSDFLWENGYTEADEVDGVPSSMTFSAAQYEREINTALDRVSQLPQDDVEYLERRRPWPCGWRRPPRGSPEAP